MHSPPLCCDMVWYGMVWYGMCLLIVDHSLQDAEGSRREVDTYHSLAATEARSQLQARHVFVNKRRRRQQQQQGSALHRSTAAKSKLPARSRQKTSSSQDAHTRARDLAKQSPSSSSTVAWHSPRSPAHHHSHSMPRAARERHVGTQQPFLGPVASSGAGSLGLGHQRRPVSSVWSRVSDQSESTRRLTRGVAVARVSNRAGRCSLCFFVRMTRSRRYASHTCYAT